MPLAQCVRVIVLSKTVGRKGGIIEVNGAANWPDTNHKHLCWRLRKEGFRLPRRSKPIVKETTSPNYRFRRYTLSWNGVRILKVIYLDPSYQLPYRDRHYKWKPRPSKTLT